MEKIHGGLLFYKIVQPVLLLAAAFGRIPRLYQNKYSKNSLDFKKYLCYTRNKRSNNDATRVRSCRGDGRTEFL